MTIRARVLAYLKEFGELTALDVEGLLDIDFKNTSAVLAQLCHAGSVVRSGFRYYPDAEGNRGYPCTAYRLAPTAPRKKAGGRPRKSQINHAQARELTGWKRKESTR